MYTEIKIKKDRINKNRENYLKIYRATHSEDKRYNKHSYNNFKFNLSINNHFLP